MKKIIKNNNKGAIATLALLGMSVIALSIAVTLTSTALEEFQMSENGGALESTFYAAESGLNEALYRLISDPTPGSRNFTFNNIEISVSVSSNPSDPASVSA